MPEVRECPAGQVKRFTAGRCPTSYCERAEEEPPLPAGEVKGLLRQINDQRRELTKLVAKAKRVLPGVLPEIQALQKQLEDFAAAFSGKSVTRSQVQDYYDAKLWDAINPLRERVSRLELIVKEMPREIKRRKSALSPLEKFLKGAQVRSALGGIGINTDGLNQTIAEWKSALEQFNALYQAVVTNPTEEAIDAAEDARASLHQPDGPAQEFEIRELYQRLRELYIGYAKPLLKVKDEEVKAALVEFLSEVVEAMNNGEYREAQEAFANLPPELRRIFVQQAQRVTAANRARLLQRLEQLSGQKP